MNLSKVFVSFITFFLITCLFFEHSCNALDKGDASFMDLESSVKELRSLVDKNSPGIVFVSVYDDTGALRSSGSGFFVDNAGRIITKASIWKDAYSAEVRSDRHSYSEILMIDRNDELDIALIQVKALNETPLESDLDYKAAIGERVIVIGKLANLNNAVSEGLISAFPLTDRKLKFVEIQKTASILPLQPSKEGPVLNAAGRVIGFTSGTISDGIWRGFDNDKFNAVSLQSIKSLLSGTGHTEQLHTAKSKIWFKWFLSSLKSAALEGFLYLYDIGSSIIITYLFVIILIIYIIKRFYMKYKYMKYKAIKYNK